MSNLLIILFLLMSCDNNDIETYRVAKPPSVTKNIQKSSTSGNHLDQK